MHIDYRTLYPVYQQLDVLLWTKYHELTALSRVECWLQKIPPMVSSRPPIAKYPVTNAHESFHSSASSHTTVRTVRYTVVSTVFMHWLIGFGQIIKATSYQSFVCHCHVYRYRLCREPVSSPATPCLVCQFFRYPHFQQVLHLGPRFLPLLPYAHAGSVI